MARQPNILLIMSDQHSPHVLGCTGDEVVRTPHLDALAASGVRFTDTSCGNPLCVPSRMTFLTSRHSSDIRVWSNGCQLRSDTATFVHYLVNCGYETVLCGRMHFAGQDQRHGFERRILGDVHARLEHIPLATTGQSADGVRPAGPGRTAYSRYDNEVTRVCRRFLEERDESSDDRPFFLCAGFVLPHCPYICPKPLFDEYYAKVDVPQLPAGYLDRLHPYMQKWRRHRDVDSLTDEEVRVACAAYYGLVTHMDERIGEILDTLSRTRYAENTLVVYTSDHGDMAGEHRMWWKSSFYQGSVGVPLIYSWPRHIAQGRTVSAVTSLLDIGPTLVDFGGSQKMSLARGESHRGFLTYTDEEPKWWPMAFAEYAGLQGDAPGRMMRHGPWKLNFYLDSDRPQLFNLDDDPGEWNDLGDDSSMADIRDKMMAQVQVGWSGVDLLNALDRVDADREVLREFRQNVRRTGGDMPDRWTAPSGCNIFPES